MGIVYKAREPVIDRVVAIKQVALAPELSPEGRAEFMRRFFREAKAAGKLQHPTVVTIYDMGEEEGSPFMAMEFVEGVSLGQFLMTRGPLPPEEALALTRQIARGLAYAHEQGVVHRDVKPDIDQLGLHPRLAALLARLLAKRWEDRYPDGEALVQAIDSVLGAIAGEATLPADCGSP